MVSRSLTEVLKEADGRWRATWDEGQVRKAEMMNKVCVCVCVCVRVCARISHRACEDTRVLM